MVWVALLLYLLLIYYIIVLNSISLNNYKSKYTIWFILIPFMSWITVMIYHFIRFIRDVNKRVAEKYNK